MKKTISIMTVSLLTATTVATASPSKTIEFGTLNKSDSHMLFGQSNQNIVTLGQDEMKKTQGEYGWWGAVAGAATGAYGYIGYSADSSSFSWRRLGAITTQGAIAGALLPTPTAVRFVANSHVAMGAGAATGWLWRYKWLKYYLLYQ